MYRVLFATYFCRAKLEGKWDQYLDVTYQQDTKNCKKGDKKRLFEVDQSEFLGDVYNFTKFTASLNGIVSGKL